MCCLCLLRVRRPPISTRSYTLVPQLRLSDLQVTNRTVADGEAELRLDRWFKRHFPWIGHGKLEKLLRTGQVRVDGGRAKASTRLEARSEEHTSELQSLMRISYAVFCLKKNKHLK